MTNFPIEFPVKVKEHSLTATIEAETSNEVQAAFQIRFSNGYSDEFVLDEENGAVSGSDFENSKPYANALNNDLPIVIIIDPKKFFQVFQAKIDDVDTNIWVVEDSVGDDPTYKVYYNSFCRFELKRSGDKWVASSISENAEEINSEIAKKAGYLLHSLV